MIEEIMIMVICFIIGACGGFLLSAICVTSAREDKIQELMFKDYVKKKMEDSDL